MDGLFFKCSGCQVESDSITCSNPTCYRNPANVKLTPGNVLRLRQAAMLLCRISMDFGEKADWIRASDFATACAHAHEIAMEARNGGLVQIGNARTWARNCMARGVSLPEGGWHSEREVAFAMIDRALGIR